MQLFADTAASYAGRRSGAATAPLCWNVCRLAIDVVIPSRYLSTAAALAR
jgi:hypothetical protein